MEHVFSVFSLSNDVELFQQWENGPISFNLCVISKSLCNKVKGRNWLLRNHRIVNDFIGQRNLVLKHHPKEFEIIFLKNCLDWRYTVRRWQVYICSELNKFFQRVWLVVKNCVQQHRLTLNISNVGVAAIVKKLFEAFL